MVQIPCALNNLREALSMLSPTGVVNPERTRLGAWLLESGVEPGDRPSYSKKAASL